MAGNIRRHYPSWVALSCITLLLVANIINLGADLGSMGDVAHMLIGGPRWPFVIGFGLISVVLQVLVQYTRYVAVLKWLTVALFAYFGVLFFVHVPWAQALRGLLVPTLEGSNDYISLVVAVLGTISPYLFFGRRRRKPKISAKQPLRERLTVAPEQAPVAFVRIRLDLDRYGVQQRCRAGDHADGCRDIACGGED